MGRQGRCRLGCTRTLGSPHRTKRTRGFPPQALRRMAASLMGRTGSPECRLFLLNILSGRCRLLELCRELGAGDRSVAVCVPAGDRLIVGWLVHLSRYWQVSTPVSMLQMRKQRLREVMGACPKPCN